MGRGNRLSQIRIFDLSNLLPGPYCSLLLADLGAEVIKIENVSGGDPIRQMLPLLDHDSVYFHALNRNKKSLKLNLQSTKGQEIFKQLVPSADVIIESFRPGVMPKLNLAYDELVRLNRGLIYCAITGYGQNGPYSNKAGHDINYISIAGILGCTGRKGNEPIIPSVQIADLGGALFAALNILAALFERAATGKGKFLDVSLSEAALSFLTIPLSKHLMDKEPVHRGEQLLSGGLACYNVYGTKDGKYLSIGALETKFWREFLKAVGKENLVEKQFDSDQPALKSELSNLFETKTRDEWLNFLGEKDVCCEPVYDLEEVPHDPQIRARAALFKLHLDNGKHVDQIRTPLGIPANQIRDRRAPKYGEHTCEILKELGYSEKELTKLVKENVI